MKCPCGCGTPTGVHTRNRVERGIKVGDSMWVRGHFAGHLTEDSRRCAKCKNYKPKSDFAQSSRASDGRQATCRACAAQYRKENAEQIAAKKNAWIEANSERARATAQAWYIANADRLRDVRRRWRLANPDKARAYVDERRARRAAAETESVDRWVVWERDQGVCRLCDTPADPENWWLEHLTPLVRGGSHSYENTAVSHPKCNRMKHMMTFEEWMSLVHA